MTTTFDARAFINDACMSDAHKDAYGFRPTQDVYAHWLAMSEAELTAELDGLYADVERAIDEEDAAHERHAVAFEARVAECIAAGAGDRATALRWLIDAEGDAIDVEHYGLEHFEWAMGLKFGYLRA